ncbi:hypothetical protein CF319_g9615 [Tilletia indica]|nr:hypothetical protein CF319_g9615 [Tilletia indica]
MSEEELVNEVVDGLEPAVAKLIQAPFRNDPTLTALRHEMRIQETFWRKEFLGLHDRIPTNDADRSSRGFTVRVSSISFDSGRLRARNISYRLHPDSKKRMMAYKIPGTNRIMWCARACRSCGGDHFDFAHEHCVKHTVPTVNTLDVDEEDYPQTVDNEDHSF